MNASSVRTLARAASAVVLLSAATTGVSPAQIVPIQPRPDLCAIAQIPAPVTGTAIDGVGQALRYYLTDQTAPPDDPRDRWSPKVVVIVNGNTYTESTYRRYAEFLARQGFLPIVVERTNNTSFATGIVKEALDAVFAELDLPMSTPVALIGHSRGGGVVVNAAVANASAASPYVLSAVVSLAPNAVDVEPLTPAAVSDFLLLYGSQDEDMSGTSGDPHEAFALYDRAGSEGTTTCTNVTCAAAPGEPPPMERTMIYIHGADHPGMIGKMRGESDPGLDYLDFNDQGCLSRSYVAGFLRWKMMGESHFKGMLRDEWRATTASSIVTDEPDYMGNAAGSPLRMSFQVSPRWRRVVEDFQDGVASIAVASPGVEYDIIDEGEFGTSPNLVRHETRAMLVGWTDSPGWQSIALNVPASSRNTVNFSDVAVRVGIFHGAPAAYRYPANTDGELWIGLDDGSTIDWSGLHDWGTIMRNDEKSDSTTALSAMSTVSIPLGAFSEVDRTDVRRIHFMFRPDTRGTYLVDNIEFWKD